MREIVTNVPAGAVRKIHEKLEFVNKFFADRRRSSLSAQIVRGDFGYDISGIVTHIERFEDIFLATRVLDGYVEAFENQEERTVARFNASFIKRLKDELQEPTNFDFSKNKFHFDIELDPEKEEKIHRIIDFIKLIHGYKFKNPDIGTVVTLRNSSYRQISISSSKNKETGEIEFVSGIGYNADAKTILANKSEAIHELTGYLRA